MLGSAPAKDEVIGSVHQRIDPEKELEADRISIEILRRAGYDPHAAVSVAELLADSLPDPGVATIIARRRPLRFHDRLIISEIIFCALYI
jgi:hypothetical protein